MATRIPTCVIGSYPHEGVPNWFAKEAECLGLESSSVTDKFSKLCDKGDGMVVHLDYERQRVIRTHEAVGIGIITDGEVGRENYIHYLLRSWQGVDFHNLEEKSLRDGAYRTHLPVLRSALSCSEPESGQIWKRSSLLCLRPLSLKYTLPGPLTILDTVVNKHYANKETCLFRLAKLINKEMLSLQREGCVHIQLDEPVYARYSHTVQKYGARLLECCFQGIKVHKSLHVCCGYPNKLEQIDYQKADPESYLSIARVIDNSPVDSVSIENAQQQNELAALLPLFQKTIVILGVIRIATTQLETVDEIVAQGLKAASFLPEGRLWLAPDCGLGMLPSGVAKAKLAILAEAAIKLGESLDQRRANTQSPCSEEDDE